jgi:hypothetical protein
MTDRELLELAAKAAGYELEPTTEGYPLYISMFGLWNPLEDDGDALRLAVKLNLRIMLWGHDIPVQVYNNRTHGADEPTGDNPYAATRRAIVRAAAEIGKLKE